uniref:Putative secreted protein n=1 Tax=Anopheles darlingi TaxID=43151 RepID=A0A2M4D1M1_ANODA
MPEYSAFLLCCCCCCGSCWVPAVGEVALEGLECNVTAPFTSKCVSLNRRPAEPACSVVVIRRLVPPTFEVDGSSVGK